MNKKNFLALMLSILALCTQAQTLFRNLTFDEAVKTAKAEKKLVFIDFYTSWCGPCKLMAKQTFPQQAVGKFMNSHFVNIQLDAEKGEGITLAKHFGVKAYPTFVVTDTQRNEVARSVGYKEPNAFVTEMERLLNPKGSVEQIKQLYAAGERTPQTVKFYAAVLVNEAVNTPKLYKKRLVEADSLVQNYFETLNFRNRLLPENMFVYQSYTHGLNTPAAQFLLENRQKVAPSLKNEVDTLLLSWVKKNLYELVAGTDNETSEPLEKLKTDMKKLDLQADSTFKPYIELAEAAQKQPNEYMERCAQLMPTLNEDQLAAVMQGLANKLKNAQPQQKAQAATLIRNLLPKLTVGMIFTALMPLSTLEGQDL